METTKVLVALAKGMQLLLSFAAANASSEQFTAATNIVLDDLNEYIDANDTTSRIITGN